MSFENKRVSAKEQVMSMIKFNLLILNVIVASGIDIHIPHPHIYILVSPSLTKCK